MDMSCSPTGEPGTSEAWRTVQTSAGSLQKVRLQMGLPAAAARLLPPAPPLAAARRPKTAAPHPPAAQSDCSLQFTSADLQSLLHPSAFDALDVCQLARCV